MSKTHRKSVIKQRSYGDEDKSDSYHIKRTKQHERTAKSWKQLDHALRSRKNWSDVEDNFENVYVK